MIEPPVGEVCSHSKITPRAIQLPAFRYDDDDSWIYYHGFIVKESVRKDREVWNICGKPELWMWQYYQRECGSCGVMISNPWVPVCDECWSNELQGIGRLQPYPSWDFVIKTDMRLL